MASIRVPKVNIEFDIQIINDDGLVVDSRNGSIKLHEAGFDIKVSEIAAKLTEELLRSQAQQQQLPTPEEGKDEENG